MAVSRIQNKIIRITVLILITCIFITGCGVGVEPAQAHNPVIVWLGDSLTQGSLGDDGDNYIGAPPLKLMEDYDLTVEGYGFYGNTTHDVLWRYEDPSQENQTIDPDKVYIFWLGSNDWVIGGEPNCDTGKVTAELDDFINKGNIDKYIIMGTTARYELKEEMNGQPMYDIINDGLKSHYGDNYMDVAGIIGDDGYGPDNIHLKQDGYDRVAEAVYEKLKDLGYIK